MSRGKRYSKVDLYERGRELGVRSTWTEEYNGLLQSMSFILTARCRVVYPWRWLWYYGVLICITIYIRQVRIKPLFANKHKCHACCLFREERWNRKRIPARRFSCLMWILAHKNAILLLSCVVKKGALIYANYPWCHGYRKSVDGFICLPPRLF